MVINVSFARKWLIVLLLCCTVCLQAGSVQAQASSNQLVHLKGVVMPAQKVKLSFAQAGIIRQLAGGGSLVEKGQVIAKLDDKKAKAQLAQSQAEYRSAKSELASVKHSRDKNARLVEQNILSEVALTEADFTVTVAQEKLAVARAKLDMAEATLIDCTVLAPFSGAVVAVNASKGEWMKQGDPFVEFVNFKKLSLSIDIPPEMTDGLAVGLTTDVLDKARVIGQAKVKTIFPVIDPSSGLRRIVWQVTAKDGMLLSGRYVSLASWAATNSTNTSSKITDEGGQ
jgi:RND family efflux transporter MFP subunit